MVDPYVYGDDILRIRLPGYLRPKKATTYFVSHGRGKDDRDILSVFVEVFACEEDAEPHRQNLKDVRIFDWMGVQRRVVRRGEADYVVGGFELLLTSYNPDNHDTVNNYDIILDRGAQSALVAILGQGDPDSFDRQCREIVSSFELVSAGGNHASSGRERPGAGTTLKGFPTKRDDSTVLRTDFSDDSAWESLCRAVREPVGEFRAYVDFISDPECDGLTVEQLVGLDPQGAGHDFLFLADRTALSHADHPILVVDLDAEPGRTFRVIPSEMWSVENNLSIANMDFHDFADSVDPDGVFRGFPES